MQRRWRSLLLWRGMVVRVWVRLVVGRGLMTAACVAGWMGITTITHTHHTMTMLNVETAQGRKHQHQHHPEGKKTAALCMPRTVGWGQSHLGSRGGFLCPSCARGWT